MIHIQTEKERIDRRLDRLEKATNVCSSADAIDAAFYIGEDSAKLTDEQINRFESLNKMFWEECECKKKVNRFV